MSAFGQKRTLSLLLNPNASACVVPFRQRLLRNSETLHCTNAVAASTNPVGRTVQAGRASLVCMCSKSVRLTHPLGIASKRIDRQRIFDREKQ